MRCIDEAVALGAETLSKAGIEAPRREARLLLAHVLKADLGHLLGHGEESIGNAEWSGYLGRLERRAQREPLSRIVGYREFWGLPFQLGPDTLDPRPDSETLVEAVLQRFHERHRPLRILDLGTGSGCLLISLLVERPYAVGVGIDRSFAAAAVAAGNAARLGVGERSLFSVGNWLDALAGRFDVIVANPPYVKTEELSGLAPEVAEYEPKLALDGGKGGLDCYRAIASGLFPALADGGLAFLELGEGQADAVEALLRHVGFSGFERLTDLAGRERCLAVGP